MTKLVIRHHPVVTTAFQNNNNNKLRLTNRQAQGIVAWMLIAQMLLQLYLFQQSTVGVVDKHDHSAEHKNDGSGGGSSSSSRNLIAASHLSNTRSSNSNGNGNGNSFMFRKEQEGEQKIVGVGNPPDDWFPKGLLSQVSETHLRSLQREVDDVEDHAKRCRRYGFVYNSSAPKNRRIFFGSNIADEPWELFEIVAAEAYGIFEGMVYVESNRTYRHLPRSFQRLHHDGTLRRLFNASQVQVRSYMIGADHVNASGAQEHLQRTEIVQGWKEMGMTSDDIGYITDADETFSRDFLRAVQVCDGIPALDYESHRCGRGAKLLSSTRVFEMTPECTANNRNWYHPDMMLGACMELIGDETQNPVADRNGLARSDGFGDACIQTMSETDRRYPLWTPYDVIFVCGGDQVRLIDQPNYDFYTGYRFRNFYTDFAAMRRNDESFDDPNLSSFKKPLEEFGEEIRFAISCIKNDTELPTERYKRVMGGFEALKPTLPLYFLDKTYRQRKQANLQEQVKEDEKKRKRVGTTKMWPFFSERRKRSIELKIAKTVIERPVVYPDDGFPKGILSNMSIARLRSLQRAVDEQDHTERCRRYGFFYNSSAPKRRRIFYGSNIATEPWELITIVAAEAYGIFEGMVYVEANRTHNFVPRPFRRLKHDVTLRELFGTQKVQVRPFVNDERRKIDLERDNMQRYEILQGWKEMGMTAEDIGYIADADETFSRDFLRAAQVCDGIKAFDYKVHRCGVASKMSSSTRVFEMTPECVSENRIWYHPDMILGACVEKIGNEMLNPIAERNGVQRLVALKGSSSTLVNESDRRYPLWTPYDFKMIHGGDQVQLIDQPNYELYTGYHFHNFFADFRVTRFKYFSYAHADPHALNKPLEELNPDVKFAVRCVKNLAQDPDDKYKRVMGGFDALKPTLPLYFFDEKYRQERHADLKRKVEADEKERLDAEIKTRELRRSWPFLSESQKRSSEIADARNPFSNEEAAVYPDDGFPKGILSDVSVTRLRSWQRAVDEQDHTERCRRYGFFYNSSSPKQRKIFFGSNIADEPWEMFEIVAAEAYGIFAGVVYVESNRTTNMEPRPFRRLNHDGAIRRLFSADQVQVRRFVSTNNGMGEYIQRNEIVKGWKEMGMTVNDIGYISDPDETLSRDFLRAVQVCDGIEAFDYESHRCGRAAKLLSSTRVFEMTPECTAEDRNWHHPDMMLGACIEMIGNEKLNPIAARSGLSRLPGFGDSCIHMMSETDRRYPLWTPYDLTFVCGLDQVRLIDQPNYDFYTGYRFHNFFVDFNATRSKYFSYENFDSLAFGKALEELGAVVKFGVRCVKNITQDPEDQYKRVIGGFDALKPTLPLYFLDERYRMERHAIMKRKVESDEK